MKQIILFILIIAFILSGCHRGYVPMPDNNVLISVIDKDGVDLLNPQNENAIENIYLNIYHEKDGELVRQRNNTSDFNQRGYELIYPGYFLPETYDGNYRISILPSTDKQNSKSLTVIEWGSGGHRDSLTCEFRRNSSVITKLYYNGELKWSESDHTERYFTIVRTIE
jgi:hypothetical protein